jgi:hypothetical protein
MRASLVKRSSGADNILLFLISSAVSVVGVRMFLHAFNYPQLAPGSLHIAHAIYGGLFLTISVLLLLSFHGRRVRQAASIIAGLGFGQFIDEIGKFVTKDNNYFYQPTPVIIYIFFISFFFLYRYLDRYTPKGSRELTFDLIEKLEDLADNRFFQSNRAVIEDLVTKILLTPETGIHWLAKSIEKFIPSFPLLPTPKQSKITYRFHSSLKWLDDLVDNRRPTFYFLLFVFSVYVVLSFWTMSAFIYRLTKDTFDPLTVGINTKVEWYVYLAELGSQVLSAIWMCQGFWRLLRRQRRKALLLFKNGLAINLLVTHVFAFYIEQFSAVVSLVGTLILFAIVNNLLEELDTKVD